ncbi:hypothetical protein BGX29_011354 [Mortierella sp. GBA35]|nr:hypothetical protein BGX29_011354 [Mortierella sp. GBA35]
MRKVKCHFDKCHHGFLDLDSKPTKAQEDHIRRYHQHVTHTLGLMGAIFCFSRDPSTRNKYVCACSTTFSNRYSLDHHVKGSPSKSHGPCPVMCKKAREVVTTNARCEDKTMSINYWPEGVNTHLDVHAESDINVVESIDAESMDVVESVDAESMDVFGSLDDESTIEDENINLRNILMENDRALSAAIKVLHKAQLDTKRALGHMR